MTRCRRHPRYYFVSHKWHLPALARGCVPTSTFYMTTEKFKSSISLSFVRLLSKFKTVSCTRLHVYIVFMKLLLREIILLSMPINAHCPLTLFSCFEAFKKGGKIRPALDSFELVIKASLQLMQCNVIFLSGCP